MRRGDGAQLRLKELFHVGRPLAERLDGLVNNAGIAVTGPLEHLPRSEEHTSELQSPEVISYAVSLDRKSTRLNSSHPK